MNAKRILTTIILTTIISLSFGQQSNKLEISAFCPVLFGGNYINKSIKEYVGLSGTWVLDSKKQVRFGAQVNMAYLHRKEFETPLYMFTAVSVVSYKYEVSD
ncbi:MAG: hypothetical protein JEZ03_13615 [Bacteroidales bacterium]|nr:hypothetical protein [Bacteroidales bacterium]